MFDILLTVCLLGAPDQCRTDRLPGGADAQICQAEARKIATASSDPAQSWPCIAAGESPAFTVSKIAPGVYVHKGRHEEPTSENRGDVSNLSFVIGQDAVAVIDAGDSPFIARGLLAEIRARTNLPIKWVIFTHMHPDHVLGAQVFRGVGARAIGAEKLRRGLAMRAGSYIEAQQRLLGDAYEPVEVVLPDETVSDMREIDLGGRILRLESHPTAHTDNDLTVYDTVTGTWFLGDLLFVDHMPALDGSLRGWSRLMESLVDRSAARVVPGHGPAAAAWPSGAESQRAYLNGLAAAIRGQINAGNRMSAAINAVGYNPDGGPWLLIDDFGPRNAAAAFTELEWE